MYKYFVLYFKKIIFVSPYKYTCVLSSLPADLVVIIYVFLNINLVLSMG